MIYGKCSKVSSSLSFHGMVCLRDYFSGSSDVITTIQKDKAPISSPRHHGHTIRMERVPSGARGPQRVTS